MLVPCSHAMPELLVCRRRRGKKKEEKEDQCRYRGLRKRTTHRTRLQGHVYGAYMELFSRAIGTGASVPAPAYIWCAGGTVFGSLPVGKGRNF